MSFQSTFTGRFRHFLDVIDPSTLFITEVWWSADKELPPPPPTILIHKKRVQINWKLCFLVADFDLMKKQYAKIVSESFTWPEVVCALYTITNTHSRWSRTCLSPRMDIGVQITSHLGFCTTLSKLYWFHFIMIFSWLLLTESSVLFVLISLMLLNKGDSDSSSSSWLVCVRARVTAHTHAAACCAGPDKAPTCTFNDEQRERPWSTGHTLYIRIWHAFIHTHTHAH